MIVKQLLDWKFEGEAEVLGEILPWATLYTPQIPEDPGIESNTADLSRISLIIYCLIFYIFLYSSSLFLHHITTVSLSPRLILLLSFIYTCISRLSCPFPTSSELAFCVNKIYRFVRNPQETHYVSAKSPAGQCYV
jgi:hypothetical protein